MKLRQKFVLIHRYVGMLLGLVVCIIALTGTLLSFNHEIDHALNPALMTVNPQGQPLAAETLLAAAQKTHPDYKISYFEPPKQAEDSYKISLSKEISEEESLSVEVFVNPYTGAILGERKDRQSFMSFIYALHYELASGKWGSHIISITALAWIVIGISGLLIWPNWQRIKQGLKVRWQAPWVLVNYDYHKVLGIIAAVFILVLGVSGTIFQFHDQIDPVVVAVTGSTEPPEFKSQPGTNQTRLPYSEIIRSAEQAIPNATTTWVSYPSEPEEAIEVDRKQPGDINQWGNHWVFVDQYSGKVLGMTLHDTVGATPAETFNIWNWNIHTGIWGGMSTRILLSIFGLTPVVLLVTGVLIFWNKIRGVKRPPTASGEKEVAHHG